MLRQLGGVLFQSPCMDLFQRASDLLMESDAARRDHLVIQRLPKERVAEAIHDRRADDGALFDDGRGRSFLERCLELIVGHDQYLAQDVQLELAPDDRGHAEDSIRAIGQPRQSLAHRVAQPLGDPTGQTLIADPLQRAIAPLHEAGVDHVSQRLVDKQWVALGLAVNQLGERMWNRLTAGFGQQAKDLVGRESTQLHACHVAGPVQLGERRR